MLWIAFKMKTNTKQNVPPNKKKCIQLILLHLLVTNYSMYMEVGGILKIFKKFKYLQFNRAIMDSLKMD